MLVTLAVMLALYFAAVSLLLVAGQRENARALAGFVPDCIILLSRLLREPCVPRRRGLVPIALVAYLSSPIDLIPDFLPGVGHLDDAVILALALRWVVRECTHATIEAHWPGPPQSLRVVLKLSGAARR